MVQVQALPYPRPELIRTGPNGIDLAALSGGQTTVSAIPFDRGRDVPHDFGP